MDRGRPTYAELVAHAHEAETASARGWVDEKTALTAPTGPPCVRFVARRSLGNSGDAAQNSLPLLRERERVLRNRIGLKTKRLQYGLFITPRESHSAQPEIVDGVKGRKVPLRSVPLIPFRSFAHPGKPTGFSRNKKGFKKLFCNLAAGCDTV